MFRLESILNRKTFFFVHFSWLLNPNKLTDRTEIRSRRSLKILKILKDRKKIQNTFLKTDQLKPFKWFQLSQSKTNWDISDESSEAIWRSSVKYPTEFNQKQIIIFIITRREKCRKVKIVALQASKLLHLKFKLLQQQRKSIFKNKNHKNSFKILK